MAMKWRLDSQAIACTECDEPLVRGPKNPTATLHAKCADRLAKRGRVVPPKGVYCDASRSGSHHPSVVAASAAVALALSVEPASDSASSAGDAATAAASATGPPPRAAIGTTPQRLRQ